MAEQQLDGSKISGAPVDEHRLCATERVGAELGGIEPDAGDPFIDQSGILPRGHSTHAITAVGEQELISSSTGEPSVIVDCLSRLMGQFKPDGSTSFLLPHGGSIHRVTAQCHIIDPNSDDVTAT
jgi:hypothetical protein